MCADPNPLIGYIAQQGVQRHAVSSAGKGINPNEHSLNLQQLSAHLVRHLLGVDGGLCMNAHGRELFEHAMKAIVGRRRVGARLAITAPEDRYLASFVTGHVEFSR